MAVHNLGQFAKLLAKVLLLMSLKSLNKAGLLKNNVIIKPEIKNNLFEILNVKLEMKRIKFFNIFPCIKRNALRKIGIFPHLNLSV